MKECLKISSALIASESVEKSEKGFAGTESTRNKDYDTDEILETIKTDKSIIRKIREENRNEDQILRDLRFFLDAEKDHYEPNKTVSAFDNNYIQYESMGDKDKNLSIKE